MKIHGGYWAAKFRHVFVFLMGGYIYVHILTLLSFAGKNVVCVCSHVCYCRRAPSHKTFDVIEIGLIGLATLDLGSPMNKYRCKSKYKYMNTDISM